MGVEIPTRDRVILKAKKCWRRTCSNMYSKRLSRHQYGADADWAVLQGVHIGATGHSSWMNRVNSRSDHGHEDSTINIIIIIIITAVTISQPHKHITWVKFISSPKNEILGRPLVDYQDETDELIQDINSNMTRRRISAVHSCIRPTTNNSNN